MRAAGEHPKLSVVVPLLNEEGNLRELCAQVRGVCDRLRLDHQIIFVDDGSTDGSYEVIQELAGTNPNVLGLRFTRNFGHEAASTAGLDHADGDAIVLMDADLQDPPVVIEQMITLWREGFDIVYAVRNQRLGESAFKRTTSWLFYRIMNWLSDVKIPSDCGDFRLIDRKVLESLRQCRETDRFVRGLVAWTGFKATPVHYDRPERHAGETKYNPLRLLLLSLDAAVGFSIMPLRLATMIGFVVMTMSLIMGAVVFFQKIFFGNPIPGYPLLASGLFFLGGVQSLLLGILGEYIGRIYRQSQNRPLYLIDQKVGEVAHAAATVRGDVRDGREALVVHREARDREPSAEEPSRARPAA